MFAARLQSRDRAFGGSHFFSHCILGHACFASRLEHLINQVKFQSQFVISLREPGFQASFGEDGIVVVANGLVLQVRQFSIP